MKFKQFINEAPITSKPLRSAHKAHEVMTKLSTRFVDMTSMRIIMDDLVDVYPELSAVKLDISNMRYLGTYDPKHKVVSINPKAPLSTFAHELAHFWVIGHPVEFYTKMKEVAAHVADLVRGI